LEQVLYFIDGLVLPFVDQKGMIHVISYPLNSLTSLALFYSNCSQ
jgi:hypothetical protein